MLPGGRAQPSDPNEIQNVLGRRLSLLNLCYEDSYRGYSNAVFAFAFAIIAALFTIVLS